MGFFENFGNTITGTFEGPSIQRSSTRTNPGRHRLQEHLEKAPNALDELYGGEYDEDKFGWERLPYDVDAIESYDPTKLGEDGYALGGYNPTMVSAMNFDPYRRNRLQDVNATSASDLASAQGSMARSGGLSASDRMAMASQFNRNKIAGRSQAIGGVDELQATNLYNTRKGNAQAQTQADKYLSGEYNQSQRDLSAARNMTRQENIRGANEYAKEQAKRKYGEQRDLYGDKTGDWMRKGQMMSGNPDYKL